MDGSGAHYYFTPRAHRPRCAPGDDLHSCRPVSLEEHFRDIGIQPKRKVRAVSIGMEEGPGRAYARTVGGDVQNRLMRSVRAKFAIFARAPARDYITRA
jgi:hypothetical protein